MHDNQNLTPEPPSPTSSGRHREASTRTHVGCFFSNPIYPRSANQPGKHARQDESHAVAS